MKILFVHQNFPGQYKHLAPAMAALGHDVRALGMTEKVQMPGVLYQRYGSKRGSTKGVHPWVIDFEAKVIRGEACARVARQWRDQGYTPDVICAHPGWGETLLLRGALSDLLSADTAKADRAEDLLAHGGTISVQVLNEFVAVASRKLRLSMVEVRDVLAQILAVCAVVPLTIETHERALNIAERYGLSIYDALIVSAALMAGCKTLYSEDLQNGQVIERQLTIRNPFTPA